MITDYNIERKMNLGVQRMEVKILASDLDGTLLDQNSRISEKTAKAIKEAQNAGIHFIAVTGRSWETAHQIFQEAGIEVDYILLNGAEFRISSGEIIYQEFIQQDVAEKVIDYLLTARVGLEVNTDKEDFSTDTDLCQTASVFSEFFQFGEKKPKILKLFAFSKEAILMKNIKNHFSDWKEIFVTSSAVWNVEITASVAQKGNMLKKVIQYYGVSEDEVIIFGDGENDETMFQKFRRSRAVGNAVSLIRDLSEKVIGYHYENGVAKEIDQILKSKSNRATISL